MRMSVTVFHTLAVLLPKLLPGELRLHRECFRRRACRVEVG